MRNRILLGLDNGNKCTKTSEGYISEAGFIKSNNEPISTSNLLIYEGKFYSIGNSRLSVQMDKTVNQDAFILSLPAIADAINKAGVEGEVDAILGVGLPIVSYGTLKKKFREYFLRRDIEFNFNKKDYKINIIDCRVYPQGYSSLITVFNSYRNLLCNVIDIGGYTIDFFRVENGIIDVSACYSLPNGIITLIVNIQQELLKTNIRLTEIQIQEIVAGKEPVLFEADIMEVIKVMSEEYVENILAKIEEYGFEFRNPSIFTGGGSMMLQKFIEKCSRVKYVDFLDQFANARGYKILLEQELRRCYQ
ncbi:ParM/StbA family protein [Calorimonas adulescens]|uniref:ParM/StbA family protein n=1 Tax=Calorimonas adulescens TaxID=2606906 RepID=A0A5D8Q7L8_9THEO|nr:ParM/StbA family protein [Calorimonas adulescens]TZE80680.1 ParM/StbA family protein [Calorimonas adulescens]